MTLIIKFGRRMPRNWYKRTAQKVGGLIGFQENLWIMIRTAVGTAKRQANESGKIKFITTRKIENEDLHYQLEWLEIIIQGGKEAEQDELKDMQNFYAPFGKSFKKEMPTDNNLSKHFKTKMLGLESLEEAYKKGMGSVDNNNIANKMLEMGILLHYELIEDYDTRPIDLPI